jgi:hypothetical protein
LFRSQLNRVDEGSELTVCSVLGVPIPPTHKIRKTECGGALSADGFASSWDGVTCPSCLAKRPGGSRPSAPRVLPCVERDCASKVTCHFCNRCDGHCLPRAPLDEAAHKIYWNERPAVHVRRRRRR